MNKKIKKISMIILTSLILACTMKMGEVNAANNENLSSKSGIVVDVNDAFTTEEFNKLSNKAESIATKYNIKIVIYVDNMPGYFANSEIDAIYSLTGKANKSGLIFYFNTYGGRGERDYAFDVKGDLQKAISITYGMDKLEEAVVNKLSDDKFYKAFDTLLDMVDDFCAAKEKGKPYSKTHPYLQR